jgi:subtilisin family serine protease
VCSCRRAPRHGVRAGGVRGATAEDARGSRFARVAASARASWRGSGGGIHPRFTLLGNAVLGMAGRVDSRQDCGGLATSPDVRPRIPSTWPGHAQDCKPMPSSTPTRHVAAGYYTGTGVTVGILDSGITGTHPDLARLPGCGRVLLDTRKGKLVPEPLLNTQTAPGAARDDNGHGTKRPPGSSPATGRSRPVGIAPSTKVVGRARAGGGRILRQPPAHKSSQATTSSSTTRSTACEGDQHEPGHRRDSSGATCDVRESQLHLDRSIPCA